MLRQGSQAKLIYVSSNFSVPVYLSRDILYDGTITHIENKATEAVNVEKTLLNRDGRSGNQHL